MSGAVLRYSCTKVTAGTAAAAPKPDKDGYYTDLILGAFDITGPTRQHFPFAGVEGLFKEGSPLHRRATNGALKGEWGHPRQQPGESNEAYVSRISQVDERHTAIHIRSFRILKQTDKKGNTYYQVRGDVAPSGPYGEHFTKAMQNPHENLGISIRGMSRDTWKGITLHRTFTRVFCWDVVTEPGIPEANKMDSVNMQSLSDIEIPVEALLNQDGATDLGTAFLNAGLDLRELVTQCADYGDSKRDSRSWMAR